MFKMCSRKIRLCILVEFYVLEIPQEENIEKSYNKARKRQRQIEKSYETTIISR